MLLESVWLSAEWPFESPLREIEQAETQTGDEEATVRLEHLSPLPLGLCFSKKKKEELVCSMKSQTDLPLDTSVFYSILTASHLFSGANLTRWFKGVL